MKLFRPLYELLIGAILLCLAWLINFFKLLVEYAPYFLLAGGVLIAVAVISVILLTRKRGFKNYLKSLVDTSRLRQFLRQQNSINEFTAKVNVDLNQRIYNSALKYTYIDYFPDHVEVWICIPNNATAKKALKQNLRSAEEEISSYTDVYIISAPKRQKGFYYYHGEKK